MLKKGKNEKAKKVYRYLESRKEKGVKGKERVRRRKTSGAH